MEIGEILECLDRAATRLVVQDGGANENPGKTALLDDRFLPILAGVDLPQEKREDHVIEEETTMPGAVAGTPVMQTRREMFSASMAFTSARVAVNRSVTSLKGLAGVPNALTTASRLLTAWRSSVSSRASPTMNHDHRAPHAHSAD